MKKIWEKRKQLILGIGMIAILGFLIGCMQNTSHTYIQMIVEQQQQHLLLLTRSVAQNLELYLSEQFREINILTGTPGFSSALETYYQTGEQERIKEYIYSYMLSSQQGSARIYLLDQEGKQIFQYNRYPFLTEFDEDLLCLEDCAKESAGGIGCVFPLGSNHYGLTLVNSVFGGNGYLGTVVSVYDMEDIYKKFIAPFIVSNRGEIAVRDDSGTIFMHQEKEMLGFNEEQDIDGFETLDQYESLRSMQKKQYSQEEGVAIYTSFSNGILPSQEEITAFSRMNLWGTSWYISASIPFEQVVSVEHDNLQRFSLLFSALLAVVVCGMWAIYVLMRKRQKLTLETKYLKEINSTLEELYRSQEEARHYQKLTTIGTLAGGIAHEFNNLLTPILGYSEFLKEQLGRDCEYYEDINEIHKAGIRAKEIVERILPFSRKETDASGFKAVNLDAVIRDSIKMIGLIIPSNIRLDQSLEDENVNIFGNANQIHQVLLNLYSNAIQSMEEHGGILVVKTRRVTEAELPEDYRDVSDGHYVEILIADTGCGMSECILGQIFNPFFTTKASGEGTGLGLSVVKDILINHSGFIHVESREGEGSRFYIYLPVSIGSDMVPIAVSAGDCERNQSISVLLVDDDERVVKCLRKRLEKKGYRTEGFTNPGAALKVLGSNPGRWDVVVIDLMMPQLKGTTLAQRIKILQPEISIILITGLMETEALQLWKEGIIMEIQTKPVKFEKLTEAIEQAAQKMRGSRNDKG